MRRLNNKTEFNVATLPIEDPQGARFSFGGKTFVLGKYGLGLWELSHRDEKILKLCDRKPQFRCGDPQVGPRMLVMEVSQACPLRCKYCFNSDYPDRTSKMDMNIATKGIQYFFTYIWIT